jgi:hypothetical protein
MCQNDSNSRTSRTHRNEFFYHSQRCGAIDKHVFSSAPGCAFLGTSATVSIAVLRASNSSSAIDVSAGINVTGTIPIVFRGNRVIVMADLPNHHANVNNLFENSNLPATSKYSLKDLALKLHTKIFGSRSSGVT